MAPATPEVACRRRRVRQPGCGAVGDPRGVQAARGGTTACRRPLGRAAGGRGRGSVGGSRGILVAYARLAAQWVWFGSLVVLALLLGPGPGWSESYESGWALSTYVGGALLGWIVLALAELSLMLTSRTNDEIVGAVVMTDTGRREVGWLTPGEANDRAPEPGAHRSSGGRPLPPGSGGLLGGGTARRRDCRGLRTVPPPGLHVGP